MKLANEDDEKNLSLVSYFKAHLRRVASNCDFAYALLKLISRLVNASFVTVVTKDE